MEFTFDEASTVEAVAYLLEKAGGRMNYTVLLKLLYLADRQALAELGAPITGARAVAMPYGPVLSEVLNLIKSDPRGPRSTRWKQHFQRDNFDLVLRETVEPNELSRAAHKILDDLVRRFGKKTHGQMIDYCHDNLPEWQDPNGTSLAIRPEEILRAQGKSEEEIQQTANEAEALAAMKAYFRPNR